MEQTENQQPKETIEHTSNCTAAFFVFVTVLFALALFSYTPGDIASFSTDYSEPHYPGNLLGLLGAYTIWWMLLTIGLGTHAIFFLMLLCSVRRLFFLKMLRKAAWDYYFAILLFGFAGSLLATTWQPVVVSIAEKYNLATLSGGVLGDCICGPQGFLLYILNRIGITILSAICIVVSLLIIAFYDWVPFFKVMRQRSREKAKEKAENGEADNEPEAEPSEPVRRAPTVATVQQELPLETPREPEKRNAPPAKAPAAPKHAAEDMPKKYVMPSTKLLENRSSDEQTAASSQEIQVNQERLQGVLDSFHIDGTVVDAVPGPQVTLYKIKLSSGVKVESVTGIENNIKMNLRASSVRLLAPIPGEDLVGVEVPNKVLKSVSVRGMLEDKQWIMSDYQIPILLGKNISGKTVCIDLAKAPHLLIAGATGTGKSVCMNLIVMSLLFKHSPETLRLIMVDPKKVEFSIYHDLPHLLAPVITDNSKVSIALKWACNEMSRRYRLLEKVGCRDLKSFNNRTKRDNEPLDDEGNPIPQRLPFIVIIIDELADIMLTSKNEVEGSLSRIAAVARAVGIHAILATQRPDVKVITGTIKTNFPVRISFRVSSQVDSQTIIGCKGAESLLGMGDMLYKPAGVGMERIQGGMASDDERNKVVEFITSQCPPPVFDPMVLSGDSHDGGDDADGMPAASSGDEGADDKLDLFEQAIDIIYRDRRTSISYLQRCLSIGYNKAATLVERLQKEGIIGPKRGLADAEILMTDEEYRARRGDSAQMISPLDDDVDGEDLADGEDNQQG